jgi:ubiquitin C-terminal hydrolase
MNFEKYKDYGLTGLSNLGNTCFLNATIQCLSHTYELNDFLNSEKYTQKLKKKHDSLLLVEYDNLRKMMWEENCVISPGRFVSIVQKVATLKGRDLFTGFAQNDLPEFLMFLMDCFHNSIQRSVEMNINGTPKDGMDELAIKCYKMMKTMYNKDYSEFLDMFYGIHVSSVSDVHDNILNQTPEPYFLISLPIPKDNQNPTLYDCFDLYTENEELKIDEKTKQDERYDHNGEKINAIRNIKFWSFPDILIVDLKRFANENRKIQKVIKFPLEDLDLSKYCIGYNKKSYVYDLYGICNHSGGTQGGHYHAFIKTANDEWYFFNDTNVSKIKVLDDKNLITSKAYCLFYRKKNIE